jgi:hypothetical protein
MIRCSSCRYWCKEKFVADAPFGECRRHSPIDVDSDNNGIWPDTHAEWWCGDAEPSANWKAN